MSNARESMIKGLGLHSCGEERPHTNTLKKKKQYKVIQSKWRGRSDVCASFWRKSQCQSDLMDMDILQEYVVKYILQVLHRFQTDATVAGKEFSVGG